MADREQLRQRLDEMRADRDRSLTPFLERAEVLLNYEKYGALEEAEKLLEVAQKARQTRIVTQAPITRSAAQEAAKTVFENHAPVRADGGNVFMGQRLDLRGASFTQIFQEGLKEVTPDSTPIDFVLLAMTKAQAAELDTERAFRQEPEILLENFQSLAHYLGNRDWIAHYGDSSEQWRPRGQRSVAELVDIALKALMKDKKAFPKPLTARFHDILSLHRDVVWELRKSGCIVIMDAISLRHPQLLRAYQRSLLDVFPNTSILTLTPGDNTLQHMQNMVYALQVNLQDSELLVRANDPGESMACQVDYPLQSVASWLTNQIRRIYPAAASGDGRPGQIFSP